MVLAEIGTAGVISAYFFRHMTSGYSLNVSDPIKGQPVELSDYLFVSGCGLVFWLLVMLRAKLHDSGGRQSDIRKVAKLAKLIAPITTLNLCGCLLAPFMKLPLLVRFLVLFQVSSNLALLLIWAFLSLKECMILPDTHTPQKSSPEVRVELSIPSNPIPHGRSSLPISKLRGHRNRSIFKKFFELFSNLQSSFSEGAEEGRGFTITISGTANQFNPRQLSRASDSVFNAIQASSAYGFSRTISSGTNSKVNAICGKVDEAGGSGSGHGSGASGREENRGRYGSNDGGGGAGGGGDRGASGSGHGSGASGSGGGSEGGDRGSDGGGDRGASGSGHVSGASGSGGGSEGGDSGRDGGLVELESGEDEPSEPEDEEARLRRLMRQDPILRSHHEGPTLPSHYKDSRKKRSVTKKKATGEAVHKIDGVGGNVDEAGGSGSGHGSGASGREENRGRYGGNDGGGGAGGGGDRGASGSGHGSGASGSGGGSEGGDRGRDGGLVDLESGERGTNTEQDFESSEIIKMSITLTAQTTGTLMGFHLIPTPSSSSKVLLVVALMDQLVAYLCGVTGILLSSNKSEDSKAAKIFAGIGFVCSTLGYILGIAMCVAMYVPWYSVLIVVLPFGVVWLILFRNRLKTRATKVWNSLKNSGNL